MTSPITGAGAPKQRPPFRLPDIPEKDPDDMTSFKHLAQGGHAYRLAHHLGNPESTIVSGDRYICAEPGAPIRYPDLLVAFNADPELYETNNGYVVSLQGKPPDLVLEIASRATGHIDTGQKPEFYASLGIAEYWRFDETGEFHGERLGGDRLLDGAYQSIAVETRAEGSIRGYSRVLGLYICWEQGELEFVDPGIDAPIDSMASLKEEIRQVGERADEERRQREVAEQRIRDLEDQLRQNQA